MQDNEFEWLDQEDVELPADIEDILEMNTAEEGTPITEEPAVMEITDGDI